MVLENINTVTHPLVKYNVEMLSCFSKQESNKDERFRLTEYPATTTEFKLGACSASFVMNFSLRDMINHWKIKCAA